jgi:hypothetical protein
MRRAGRAQDCGARRRDRDAAEPSGCFAGCCPPPRIRSFGAWCQQAGRSTARTRHCKGKTARKLSICWPHRCCVEPRAFIECIVALRLPAVHQWPEIAEDGGLLGYGPRFTQVFRQRARMVAKILRGAKPTDIPIEQATHFELVVNLQTAQAIGHDVPPGLVLRADKVIE